MSFTMESALKIQGEQLAEWKTRLNRECYASLSKFLVLSNGVASTPFEIPRGTDITDFLSSWKPSPAPLLNYDLASAFLAFDDEASTEVLCALILEYDGNPHTTYVDSIDGVTMTADHQFKFTVNEFLTLITF